ncbi:SLBB domain-containing protein [Pannus brasiliensis CCIBt3594]|uniref:SLBB domain-containing protein n=1 Tax=Pannus brasiliensis CCIBt3594 TaxID=1427578 RepID=A0AAW9QSQ0_9CHRO
MNISPYLLIITIGGLTAGIEPVRSQVPPNNPATGNPPANFVTPRIPANPTNSPVPLTPAAPANPANPTNPALPTLPATGNVLPTPIDPGEYSLGSGDKVRITVFQVADLSGEYLVLPDGTLSLPLIGSVKVKDMTLTQASQAISKRYTAYLKRPVVTVSLLSPRPMQIAVAGEVNGPGTYTISLEQTQKAPLLTDLIRKAGGLTTVADIGQVQIRRNVNGQDRLLQANLWDLIQKGDQTQDIVLKDGDSILVPTKKNVDVAQTRQLADANFGIDSNRELNVTVVGEVNRPGAYRLTPTTVTSSDPNAGGTRRQPARLTQAIQQAGGIKPLANIREIQVYRYNRDGSRQMIPVDLWKLLQEGDINADLLLQEGDTISIPTATAISPEESATIASASFSPATIRVKVVGEVKQPGVIEVPPNTPLNQAILTAGDFDKRRADQSKVELIRLNPNGTVTKRTISVDFAQGINEAKNPTLQNNDVIVVDRNGLAATTDTIGTIVSPIGSVLGLFNFFNPFN